MPATVPQATAVVTAITGIQAKQSQLTIAVMAAANANAPVAPSLLASINSITADLAAALTAANVVLTNTP